MFRIGKLTDYAVTVLAQLADDAPAARSVPDLAADTGVAEPTVAKVLKPLARAGLVESKRGLGGGYRLAMEPQAITVNDILVAMEGPIAIVSCIDAATEACALEPMCTVRGNWDQVNSAVRHALASVTLADMRAEPPVDLAAAAE